jgi:hypothetical protein
MKHSVPHDIGQEKAKKAAEAALAQYSQKFAKYNPKTNWVGDSKANISFSIKGMTLSGTIDVLPSSIDMDLDVPFLFRPFKAKALDIIEGEIKDWIAKAKKGEI